MKSPLGNFIRDPEFTGFSRALDRNFKFTAGILTVSAIYYYCYEANRHCDAFSVSTTRALLWDEPSRKGDERPRPPTVPEVLIGNPARSFAMVVRNVFRRMNESFQRLDDGKNKDAERFMYGQPPWGFGGSF